MIEQVHIISCEHQNYRRAGQLAMLDYFNYKLDMVEVIWGMHRDYHSEEEIVQSFVQMGAKHVANYSKHHPPNHSVRNWSNSVCEVHMRSLVHIVQNQKNTVVLEDDHYLCMDRRALSDKLHGLQKTVDTEIGVIQLQNRGKKANDLPIQPIEGAEDFMCGSVRSSHTALFITPYGAEKLLEYLRDPKTPQSIENALPRLLHDKKWVFSTIEPSHFVFPSRVLCGDCIGMKFTQHPNMKNRLTKEQVERNMSIIEKYKL